MPSRRGVALQEGGVEGVELAHRPARAQRHEAAAGQARELRGADAAGRGHGDGYLF